VTEFRTTAGPDVGQDADVLFLGAARDIQPEPGGDGGHGGRPPLTPVPAPGPDDHEDEDQDEDEDADRESVLVGHREPGAPVDPPDEPRPFGPRTSQQRPAVLPPWLSSRTGLAASVQWALRETRYHVGFHAVRSPKYAAKTAVYAPAGA